jgi:hypothetical protein
MLDEINKKTPKLSSWQQDINIRKMKRQIYFFFVAVTALAGVPIVLLNARFDTAITGMKSCRGYSLKQRNFKLELKN